MPGYKVKVISEVSGEECAVGEKGVLVVEAPLPPGCMQTVYGDDERFKSTYWGNYSRPVYSSFDWGIRDADGYYFILGRTDDVINVAGHRLGTREIEESICSHPNVSEVAVVGVEDKLKGQVAIAFVIPRHGEGLASEEARQALSAELMATVDRQLGAVARPAQVHIVSTLPKTRSGKLLRRAIQAVCEGRDAGDLTTMEDPASLQQIRDVMRR
jgi:propionyl-CoA synthetase